ncbi:hypothetical protein KZ483_24550 [Paenibacillus sp. sptzw28]|uniref:hypothetical protein n=1 Tax=Paenibacillus sp. sptzw28 TaxID=715179 RepID=UPI001C6EC30A|nr:hypothetical protein [Paenibacillus sp. sptzw28]QYR20887.1 hypothetical protein KZ483_24550 [Paenibacillus sp. sptzw28]
MIIPNLDSIQSSVILQGSSRIAYRDPAALYHEGIFRLYYTLVETEPDGQVYMYTAASESRDLLNWSKPVLLTKRDRSMNFSSPGNVVCFKDRWVMCLQKQNGVSSSFSYNLKHWTYYGSESAGENVCILNVRDQYVMFHSPENGIGIMKSPDLKSWTHEDIVLTLGQQEWDWAKGRITAGFVLDCREVPGIGKFLMFFHGTGPEDERVIFDTRACIGIAWSDDLLSWDWR